MTGCLPCESGINMVTLRSYQKVWSTTVTPVGYHSNKSSTVTVKCKNGLTRNAGIIWIGALGGGEALDFFTLSIHMDERYSFMEILKKMEARFGLTDIPETFRAICQQACQLSGELLEDWANRVLTMDQCCWSKVCYVVLSDLIQVGALAVSEMVGAMDSNEHRRESSVRSRWFQHQLSLIRHRWVRERFLVLIWSDQRGSTHLSSWEVSRSHVLSVWKILKISLQGNNQKPKVWDVSRSLLLRWLVVDNSFLQTRLRSWYEMFPDQFVQRIQRRSQQYLLDVFIWLTCFSVAVCFYTIMICQLQTSVRWRDLQVKCPRRYEWGILDDTRF